MAEKDVSEELPLEDQFKAALAYVQGESTDKTSNRVQLSNETKLQFYALFKQVTKGKCTEKPPSRLQVVNRAKWAAWNDLGNMSKEDAIRTYVDTLLKSDPNFRSKLQVHIRSKL